MQLVKRILFLVVLVFAGKLSFSQKIESIYFNLYTDSLKKAIDIISSLQIEKIVRKNALYYIEKAMQALVNYEDSEPKKTLQELSNYIVERSK